jgi:alkanesulfonate monooxygenase SsuD/methylene tetrahydromethanopterin reductase-like flavin-dependent oxidoreductase (luciferase family)
MFEWEGQFWNVPPRQVLPKPYQKPHPPIWVAALQPSTYQMAADKGIGVLSFGTNAPEMLRPHIEAYKERVRHAKPVGAEINDQWANSTLGYCGEDNREARELAAQSVKAFFGPGKPYVQDQKDVYEKLLENWGGVPEHLRGNFRSLGDVQSIDETEDPESYVKGYGYETLVRRVWEQMDADTLCDRGVIIGGDPESCIEAIRKHEEAGCDQLMILIQSETIPHEKVMKSIEMFGKYVLPEFKESGEKA